MIRSFTLRDIPLVHRLSDQGIVFHVESALTQDVRPLREALSHMLIGGQFPTYVWKEDDGDAAGFAQLRQNDDETHAHILCLGSTLRDGEGLDERVWMPFLEQLVAEAGRKGIHSLIAEVSEDGDELPVLRRAGFAVYTRQDIWAIKLFDPRIAWQNQSRLVPATSEDEWDIHLLYANTVPRMIQLVEPVPPPYYENVWVVREKDELAAFVHFHDGPAATWLRIFIHPNTELNGENIVAAAMQVIPPKSNHPIYCCVRRYQSWVQSSLEKVGFQHVSSQAMMVRHTVVRKPAQDMAVNVQNQAVAARRNLFAGPDHEGVQYIEAKKRRKKKRTKTN